jgi:homoserine O-acetyltransferase
MPDLERSDAVLDAFVARGVKRLPHARAVVLPFSEKTRGHGSHTVAALWRRYVVELLRESAR